MSSLKDTHPLTADMEFEWRNKLNPVYVNVSGTESHERATMFGEIDRLRDERDELARQRGELAARVIELREVLSSVRGHVQALRDSLHEFHAGPNGEVDDLGLEALAEDDEVLRMIDAALSVNVASDSQPSEKS